MLLVAKADTSLPAQAARLLSIAQANSYFVKPVDFEQFTEAVRDIGKYWLTINHAQSD
ncbi:MAG TPA: hypothetical protein VIJ78_09305 [Pseudolabrys sp.]